MCGRYTLKTPASRLIELFDVLTIPTLFPRYNIAPTTMVLCIRSMREPVSETETSSSGLTLSSVQREAVMMKWGLVPFWADDLSIGSRMINARSETAAEKPSFRNAMKSRRCLIIADGFYEWEKLTATKKQPWYIHMPNNEPFAMAGLWESWNPKKSKAADSVHDRTEDVLTCSILTTSANAEMAGVHDRMPVILNPEHYDVWLSGESTMDQRISLMKPLPDQTLLRYKVSTLVNKPGNDSPECIAAIDE
ncbi:MAG: SOS response-associated peptidase [Planctomyces sp.]|nr:SOS response-associated peptidase [Planctomyces sp.]